MHDKLYFQLLGLRAEESSSEAEGRDFLRRTKEKKEDVYACTQTRSILQKNLPS